jgi:Uma2 family endonuclease
MATLIVDKPLPRGADLPYDDGEPLESDWHLAAMTLLIQILRYSYRDRSDRYVAGNMFVYFDPDQVKTRNFRGPDFFVVKGVQSTHFRKSWVVWEENGLTPDYVIELASESTKAFDLAGKKAIYEQQLKTPEYVVFDPTTETLRGWRLNAQGQYGELSLDPRGWLWSEQLQLWLGVEPYAFTRNETLNTLRFFDTAGQRLPTESEAQAQRAALETQRATAEAQRATAEAQRAEAEAQRADGEARRAKAAEAEIARLRAELAKKAP